MPKTLERPKTRATGTKPSRDEQIAMMKQLLGGEKPGEETFTLEQMLGEPIPLESAWPGAFYQSPKMKHLKQIFGAMNDLESRVAETYEAAFALMDDYSRLAQELVRLPVPGTVDGDAPGSLNPGAPAYRRPTLDELQERFDLDELKILLMRMLKRDKFTVEETASGNA